MHLLRLLDLKDTHDLFLVRNTECKYNFCLPEGTFKLAEVSKNHCPLPLCPSPS